MIKRPDNLKFDEKKHAYYLGDEKLLGVSTIAKVGEDEVWGIASAWGFRIGYEGANDIYGKEADKLCYGEPISLLRDDDLREALKQARKTPWVKRDDAAERGTHIHDALEHLAQKGEPPIIEQYPENERPYIQALCQWYLDYRPEFVSTEVQVVSETHKYAGRYDIRAHFYKDGPALIPKHGALCLVDLKTSKSIYPTSHFPQLAGYELASVEMGFPKTDAQFVLNCKPDGTYDFMRSTATAEHFLSYLQAYRTIQELKKKGKG